MRKLLLLLLLVPLWSVAQTPEPTDVRLNRELRKNGGKGLSQHDYSDGDSLKVKAAYDSIASPRYAKTYLSNTFTRPQIMTSKSGGAPLTLRHLYENGGGTFGLHIEGTVLGQSGGIKFSNPVIGGVSVLRFENDQGTYAQLWGGSSTDAYAPNGLGFQFVKGNASFGLYQAGNAFHFGTSIVPNVNDMTYDPFARILRVNRVTGLAAPSVSSDAVDYGTYTAGIGNKVDKVAGKDLSTNDYTTAEKSKLAGVATGAVNAAGAAAAAPVQSVAGRTGSVVLVGEDITSGTVPDAVLSANIPRLNAANAFTSTNTFASLVTSSIKANAAGDISFLNNSGTQIMKLFADGSVKVSSSGTSAGTKFAVSGSSLFSGDVAPAATDGASANAMTVNNTVTATANNQTLYALNLSPTFALGSYTGVQRYAMYVGSASMFAGNLLFPTDNTYFIGSSSARLAGVSAVIYNATMIRPNATDLQFQDVGGNQTLRIFSSGNVNIGPSTTSTGTKLNVEGSAAATNLSLSTAAGGGSPLTINSTSGSGPVVITHLNASIPTFQITNTAAGGWAGFRFTNDLGIPYQLNVGGSTSTICPNCVNHQHVKGHAVFTMLDPGKGVLFDPTNTNGSTATVKIMPQDGSVTAKVVKITPDAVTGISDGANAPVPATGAGTIVFQTSDSSFYGWLGTVWKKLNNP